MLDEWAGSAYIVAGAIFDHLAEYDDNDVPKPYLAESITSNATFTEWTIKMRPGVPSRTARSATRRPSPTTSTPSAPRP